MRRLFKIKPIWAFVIYLILDTLCVGMGMGVPIFNILFGFFTGWFILNFVITTIQDTRLILEKTLKYAFITFGFTFILMAIIWGPTIQLLFDSNFDIVNFGMPMILFQPEESFIGWLVLMIFISPFLQLLTTIFSSYLSFLFWARKNLPQG